MTTKKREKILPDKIFYMLWQDAISDNISEKEYVRKYISYSSDNHIDFQKKYNIKVEESITLLSEIYKKANMNINDILKLAGVTKAEISKIFCIPKRTIEDWCYGKTKCPHYIKLMILRFFYLINLGPLIKLESEKKRKELKPKTYIKHKIKNNKRENRIFEEDNLDYDEFDECETYTKSKKYDDILEEYERIKDRQTRENIKNSLEVRALLEKTSYLDSIIKKKE